MIRDIAISLAAFVAGTLLAELFGAVDLGTAMTFGSIAFMATIVGLIVARGPRRPAVSPRDDGAAPPMRKPPPPPPRSRRKR